MAELSFLYVLNCESYNILCISLLMLSLLVTVKMQVSRTSHRYLQEHEMREEGGTPNIVGCIRAGLAFQLKEV